MFAVDIQIARQGAVYLDKIRAQFRDGVEAVVTRTRIVNGDCKALLPQFFKRMHQARKVFHCLPFRNLNDNTRRIQSRVPRPRAKRAFVHVYKRQPFRFHVDKQVMPQSILRGQGKTLLLTRQIEPRHHARFFCRPVQRARPAQQPAFRPAYQGFIPEYLPVAQRDNGLKLRVKLLVDNDMEQRVQFRNVVFHLGHSAYRSDGR